MVKLEIKKNSLQEALARANAARLAAESAKPAPLAPKQVSKEAQQEQAKNSIAAALAKLGARQPGQQVQAPTRSGAQEPIASPASQERTLDIPARAPSTPDSITVYDSHGRGKEITLNAKQLEFCKLVAQGKSCILIGAAGTGKTTCTKAAIQTLINNNIPLFTGEHKYLTKDLPGIVPAAYTRRATNNIKRAMSADIAKNTITIHKLLEYSPVQYSVLDEETGKMRNTMRFEPKRGIDNPLSPTISVIILDESSMISVELFEEITAAIPPEHQVIFILIGDIQQLPPVFGSAILGYKLLEWPVVELTEVYRQALDSPIISLAHRVLSGKVIDSFELTNKWNYEGQLQIIQWPKRIESEQALYAATKQLKIAYDAGKYDPDEDVILCPFNKAFGTIEINKHIANHIARTKGYLTFEIIAGFQKYYYSIGDKVLYDKEDAIITNIEANSLYVGTPFQPASYTLDYWGHDPEGQGKQLQNTDINIDAMLEAYDMPDDGGERVIQSSHKITMQIMDSGDYITIQSLGDLRKLDHAYAMTVHKSQGSEWRRVFLLFHHTHANMIRRELLYTAITRASKQLVIICEKDTFIKGINNQTIRGNTLEEKAEFFKGKVDNGYAARPKNIDVLGRKIAQPPENNQTLN